MKVALVHDYLKEPGGAEAVLMVLKKMFPEAPVYTAYAFPKYWGRYKEILSKWEIRQSWGRYLPFLPKFISYYTILSPWFFSSMDLSEFDLVIISQTGGYFPNGVKIGKNTKLVTYCHTPPRFLYGYEVATNERYRWYWRVQSEIANHILRMVDWKFAQKPKVFMANSTNVAKRIKKFYRRDSEVVYPPIEMPKTTPSVKKKDYFLMISRIIGTKNIELAVNCANKYGYNIKIAGKPIGSAGDKIAKSIKGVTVEYLGEVNDQVKQRLLSEAKGFLALERDPDFGMTTVEPMAYGTPVIAYRAGGYLETVVDGKTGIFFDDLSVEGLGKAINKFNLLKWDFEVIRKHAEKFSEKEFERKIKNLVGYLVT